MSNRTVLPEQFEDLVRQLQPQPLQDDQQCQTAIEMIDRLMSLPRLTRGQEQYMEALVQFVQAYEAEHHPID